MAESSFKIKRFLQNVTPFEELDACRILSGATFKDGMIYVAAGAYDGAFSV